MKYLLTIIFALVSSDAFAAKFEETRHVKRVFTESNNIAGFYTVEGLPQCVYGIMYIDLSTDTGRALFSIVLTAKSLNWEIRRMDYYLTNETYGTRCNITTIHAE
ncbi:MAG: hypothetical protein JKY11_03345 [Alphaproteobacteria bacterium]|nr:hypothetical protein [Alphaproteobacteria bacterium]